MIEAVGTYAVTGTGARGASPAASSYASVASAAPSVNFVGSRIRMDNLLDLAILEFRSTDTGDVLRQYPTESQIRAFQRASEIEARRDQAEARAAALDRVPDAPVEKSAAPVATPAPAAATTPVPQAETPAPQASAASTSVDLEA